MKNQAKKKKVNANLIFSLIKMKYMSARLKAT